MTEKKVLGYTWIDGKTHAIIKKDGKITVEETAGWTPKIYLVKFLTERRWMPKTSLELIIDKEKVVFT